MWPLQCLKLEQPKTIIREYINEKDSVRDSSPFSFWDQGPFYSVIKGCKFGKHALLSWSQAIYQACTHVRYIYWILHIYFENIFKNLPSVGILCRAFPFPHVHVTLTQDLIKNQDDSKKQFFLSLAIEFNTIGPYGLIGPDWILSLSMPQWLFTGLIWFTIKMNMICCWFCFLNLLQINDLVYG